MTNAKTEAKMPPNNWLSLRAKIEDLEAHIVRGANLIGNQEAEIVTLREALEKVDCYCDAAPEDCGDPCWICVALSSTDYSGKVVVDKEDFSSLQEDFVWLNSIAGLIDRSSKEWVARLDSLRGGKG